MYVFVDQIVHLEAILENFEPKNLTKILIFSYKNEGMLPRTHIEFPRLTIIECLNLF